MRGKLFSIEYMNGVKQFMSFVKGKFSDNVEILCPCSRCLNQKYLAQALVKKHILMNGMDNSYTRWIHHGEDLNVEVIEHVPAGVVHDSHNWSILALLKYPFYPLFNFDNGMNLISESLTILTSAQLLVVFAFAHIFWRYFVFAGF